jgi:hypothetical protein
MTLYVVDTDILSLYQRNHPQVCTRIRREHPTFYLLQGDKHFVLV